MPARKPTRLKKLGITPSGLLNGSRPESPRVKSPLSYALPKNPSYTSRWLSENARCISDVCMLSADLIPSFLCNCP
ncbi:hypothetical protein EMIT0P218_90096 [Pseudomonas sp. IT-P218]